jgi:hypothetical protein
VDAGTPRWSEHRYREYVAREQVGLSCDLMKTAMPSIFPELALCPDTIPTASKWDQRKRAVLDHDDVLLPDALDTMIPIFKDSTIHWAIGQADDSLPNGARNRYVRSIFGDHASVQRTHDNVAL